MPNLQCRRLRLHFGAFAAAALMCAACSEPTASTAPDAPSFSNGMISVGGRSEGGGNDSIPQPMSQPVGELPDLGGE